MIVSGVFYGMGGFLMPVAGILEFILGNTFTAIVFFSFGSCSFFSILQEEKFQHKKTKKLSVLTRRMEQEDFGLPSASR